MIKIITAYDDNLLDMHRLRLHKLENYVDNHGYELEIFKIPTDFEREQSWYKIPLIMQQIKQKTSGYTVWLDTDTIVYNDNIKIESIIDNNYDFFISKDFNNINCGIFITKNNNTMFSFFEKVWNTTEKKFPQHQWWEQDAVIQNIENNFNNVGDLTKYIHHHILNCYDGNQNKDTLFMHFPGMPNNEKISKMEKYTFSFLDKISIDYNHIQLIYALLISHKPKNVLEIGIGSARTTLRIIDAFKYNNIEIDIDCVDNFFDWKGQIPEHIKHIKDINLIVSDEYNFIDTCKKRYDFIISDADHENTDKWVEQTIKLLNPNGILIYHDITNPSYQNLNNIIEYVKNNNYQYMIFNKNSKSHERCDRGLIIIKV